jgi:hypothetical protein
MIKGNKKKERMSTDDLFYYTNDGKDVYEKYLGKVHKGVMKRPWGEDNHPSFGIFKAKGTWMWKDIAREESGNPIQFVQKLFGLSYVEAMDKILYDFELADKEVRADMVYNRQIRDDEEKDYSHISAKIQRFKNRHHQFWNCVEVNEDHCKKHNCFAVKELAINHKKYAIGEHEKVFVYLADDINKVKVYFPDREGGDRFRTNVPYRYLWDSHKIECCDKLVIHKSNKDKIVFSMLYPNNVITQNESIKVFDKNMVDRINQLSAEPWVFYGSDMDGVQKCKAITDTNSWKYINTPKALLPDINDVYSYVKKFGLKELETFCKTKELL